MGGLVIGLIRFESFSDIFNLVGPNISALVGRIKKIRALYRVKHWQALTQQQFALKLKHAKKICMKHLFNYYFLLCKKKKPVDFDGELKTGDVRYDNLTYITIKVQLFWRLRYEM